MKSSEVLMNTVSFSQAELERALLEFHDLMARCLLQDEFIVLKDSAKALREQRGLDGNGVDVGVKKKDLNQGVMNTLKEYATKDIQDDGFTWHFDNVPVRVKFITRNYSFFQNLDLAWNGPEVYKIPNPFEKYYKARFLIR